MVMLLPALALLSDILPELVIAPEEMVPRPERLVSKLNVVPESDRFVPAVYSVLLSVLLMVKFGYVPLTLVAPEPVSDTVWSGAEFEKTVPVRVMPEPAVYSVFVSVLALG